MTVTLYKNTQTDGEKPSDIYKDSWQFSPYEPNSLFAEGFTSEQAEFILPDGYEKTRHEGKDYLKKGNYLYEVFTNPDGNPGIRMIYGGSTVCKELRKLGEEPKADPKPPIQNSNAWVPRMVNGEWEIY